MGVADRAVKRELVGEDTRRDLHAYTHGESIAVGRVRASDIPNLSRDAVYRRLLAVADALAILLALRVSALIAGGSLEVGVLAALPLTVIVAKLIGLYDRDATRIHKGTLDEVPLLLQLATMATLIMFFAQGELVSAPLDEPAVAALWLVLMTAMLLGRAVARAIAGRLTPPERCLFVGDRDSADDFARRIYVQGLHAELAAVVSPGRGTSEAGDGGELLAGLLPILRAEEIDRVVLATGPWDGDELLHAIGALKSTGIRVSVLPEISLLATFSFDIDHLPGMALLGMRGFDITRSSKVVKRTFDLILSALALALVSPVLIAFSIAIKLDTRGPILFRQRRVGCGSKEFEMFKFRSMVDGADDQKSELFEQALGDDEGNGNQLFKLEDDPRITRVGKLIRRLSIDELPQLINVLRGEMSLVGPRPLIPSEDAMIEGPFRRRLAMRPGLTGHWQILGSLRVPLEDMVTLDYLYVANWSLWTDLKILARTIPYLALRGNV